MALAFVKGKQAINDNQQQEFDNRLKNTDLGIGYNTLSRVTPAITDAIVASAFPAVSSAAAGEWYLV